MKSLAYVATIKAKSMKLFRTNAKNANRNTMAHPRTIFAIKRNVNSAVLNLFLISIVTDALTISTDDKLNVVLKTTQTKFSRVHKIDSLQKKAITNLNLNFGFGTLNLTFNMFL